MRSFLAFFKDWKNLDQLIITRVIKTWGSSPRPVGSCLFLDRENKMYGSVSGGCVEGAVVKEASRFAKDHKARLLEYGVTDDEAWTVGLSCGGRIKLFMQNLDKGKFRDHLFESIEHNKPFVWVTKIMEGAEFNRLIFPNEQISEDVAQEIVDQSIKVLRERRNEVFEFDGGQYFLHSFPRKEQMLIIGAAHITADLIELGRKFDFETIVIDPRQTFTDKTVFPIAPDQLIKLYPSEVLNDFILDQSTFAVILSHDPKIDDNALDILLKKDIAYIGALGSKRTNAKRIERLKEKGFNTDQINRIEAPIGLDIRAKKPKEIALSIMAQIIQCKNQFL